MTDSVRLGVEWRAVETLAREEGWFQLDRWFLHEGNLSAEGVISAHGHRYPVRLVYPDQFPQVPAWVEPQGGDLWTSHQYRSGVLCLQHRPDNWTVTTTGVDVLRSVHSLLVTEDPLGEGGAAVPSAHQVGELQVYDWEAAPVFVGAACMERLRQCVSVDLKAIIWDMLSDDSPVLLHDAEDRLVPQRPAGAEFRWWQLEIQAFASLHAAPTGEVDTAALIAAGGFDSEAADLFASTGAARLVLYVGAGDLIAFQISAKDVVRKRGVFVLPEQSGMRSGRAPGVESKRVAIVGAGSVGSKVAESLVRSGVTRLKLLDGDVLLPDNLERHALDWRDVGLRKVQGLKRRLLSIVPGADVDIVPDNLNWQRSARLHSWQVSGLASCDVIVDATGDASTSLFLGAVADGNGRSFVSVEVFEGGIGALIATCLPTRDPPFAVGRAAFLAWCTEQGQELPESGPRRYEVLGEDGTPVVADDAAVTATAGHAARVVLDILDGDPPPAASAWLLLGYRQGWLFDGHGDTIRLDVGERPAAERAEEDAEARSFVLELLRAVGEGDTGG